MSYSYIYIYIQEQYIFVHDAVLERVTCGDTQIMASDLRNIINKLGRMDPKTRLTGFQSQFQVILHSSLYSTHLLLLAPASIVHTSSHTHLWYTFPFVHPQVLNQVTPKPDEVRSDSAHQSHDKNRNMKFLPRKFDLFINSVCL